jgi:hypothetical protein
METIRGFGRVKLSRSLQPTEHLGIKVRGSVPSCSAEPCTDGSSPSSPRQEIHGGAHLVVIG